MPSDNESPAEDALAPSDEIASDEPQIDEPVQEITAEVVAESPAKAPRRKRPPAASPRKASRPSRKAPVVPASTAAEVAPEPHPEPVAVLPVVRSGSTDRHLVMDDIPVDPEPVRRPRSVRDLDAVPDDFD